MDYQEAYFKLVRAMGTAADILVAAMKETEEQYISDTGNNLSILKNPMSNELTDDKTSSQVETKLE